MIEIPAEPAEADQLPELLKGFGAVPPLVTDINLSLDDQQLYVSCWGTGDFIQYDVSDPFNPKETGRVRLGGIASREPHPGLGEPADRRPADGRGSRDGRRVYVTTALYTSWDQPVLPGRAGRVHRQVRRQAGRRDEARPGFLVAEFDGRVPPSGAARRRRRLVRLILLPVSLGELAGIAGLGAFHGINPAMGWLFAVALGLQERSRAAVVGALGPIAAGHAVSIALTVAVVEGLEAAVSPSAVRIVGAAALVTFAVWKLVKQRHPRWVGFRIGPFELAFWSFLMATAHGAGLMLFPFLVGTGHTAADLGVGAGAADGALAVAVHTGAMVATAGVVAVLVFETVGVGILRSAWLNVDRLWAGALLVGAAATLLA